MKMIIILIYKVKRKLSKKENTVKAAFYPNHGLICEEFARLIFVLIFARFKGIEKKLITISLSPTNFKLRF